ncbi:zinc dependent phospholipase C family protein [Clostridia bacterium]|nr:zinc dependent phospholipase C family protein [Clostridia bacterium]
MTHSLFAMDSLKLLPKYRKIEGTEHNALLTLGAQGADPFFYFGKQPCRSTKGYPELAGILHTEKTDEFLVNLWQFVKEGKADTTERFSYAWGFTGHYTLDTQCHPYVYAQAGFAFNGTAKTDEMTSNHMILEANIDALLYNKKTGKNIKKVKLWEWMPDTLPTCLDQFYGRISEMYDYSTYQEGDFERAMKDMKLAQRFLYDPQGCKESLSRMLARIKGRSVYIGKPVYPTLKYVESLDCMNESHQKWSHPMDENKLSQDSFVDLYDQALVRMAAYWQHIELFLKGEGDLDAVFEGYSYDTKIRWDSAENRKKVSGPGLLQGRL